MRSKLIFIALTVLCGTFFTAAAGGRCAELLSRHGVFGAAVSPASNGVVVTAVLPGSSAAAAGVAVKDVIIAIDGQRIETPSSYLSAVHVHSAGQSMTVEVLRNASHVALSAVLKAPPDERDPGLQTSYESIGFEGSLRRTLVTAPVGAHGRLPAVLLIGGIGCYTVDDALNKSDGYMQVMHDIARAGFVTMRLEKSGVGDSQGPPCHDVDFNTESRSYAKALDVLRHDPRVDPNHVFLLGHSIGTAIAPRLAQSQPVSGIIFSDGVARDWFEYELLNLRRQLELGGDRPDVVDAKMLEKARCMQRLLYDKEPEADIERTDPACKVHNRVYPVEDAYVQQVAALDNIGPWEHLNIPVLAIYGTSDFVVDPADHRRIVDVVNAHTHGSATLAVVEGMDHPLDSAATQEIALHDSETGAAEPYKSDFSKIVVAWLLRYA